MIIYQVTNKVNGKNYIGQTIQKLSARKGGHKYEMKQGSNTIFYNAIRKYGWDNFSWCVIDDTCQSQDELNEMEYHYIKQCGDYNICDGGDCITTSDEWIQRHKDGCKERGRSEYIVISPSNSISVIKGISKFCKENGLSQPKMSDMAHGNRRLHKGWKCFHYDITKRLTAYEQYKVIFTSKNNTIKAVLPNGDTQHSDNITHFAKINNISREWIYDVIYKNRKTYNGWQFSKCNIQEYIDYIEGIISQAESSMV